MEPPKKQRFENLSSRELKDHIAFDIRALDSGGAAEITIESEIGPIPLWKRIFASKPPELEFQFSAGHLGRERVTLLRDAFDVEGIEFKERHTKERKQLSRILVRCLTIDELGAVSAVRVLECAAKTLGASEPFAYSVYHRGNFLDDYLLQEHDPLTPATSYVVGHYVGRIAGKIFGSKPNQEN